MARKQSKVEAGSEGVADYVRVKGAIHEWIRDDAPVSVKMGLRPEHIAKLVDRICGSKTRFVETEATK